ncbi:hypothetical protein IMSAG025_02483 [Muribaculaceae bacterium]|nr:hypothetical protein IMSAG025_02483 [Muribaculaceae bacterium]
MIFAYLQSLCKIKGISADQKPLPDKSVNLADIQFFSLKEYFLSKGKYIVGLHLIADLAFQRPARLSRRDIPAQDIGKSVPVRVLLRVHQARPQINSRLIARNECADAICGQNPVQKSPVCLLILHHNLIQFRILYGKQYLALWIRLQHLSHQLPGGHVRILKGTIIDNKIHLITFCKSLQMQHTPPSLRLYLHAGDCTEKQRQNRITGLGVQSDMTVLLIQNIVFQFRLCLRVCGQKSVPAGNLADTAGQYPQPGTPQHQKETSIGDCIHTPLPPFYRFIFSITCTMASSSSPMPFCSSSGQL